LKLDLQKGYFQVPVAAGNVPKTTITTPFGLLELLWMPFSLKNANMTFQRLMDMIFLNLPFVFVYLDDLLVSSRSAEEHRHQLLEVLQWLQDNSLVLNIGKCQFGLPGLDFLGHTVSATGTTPLPTRVEAIKNFPWPAVVRELQAFLGLFNFYLCFVPKAAAIVRLLTNALCGSLAPTAAVSWTVVMV
jgi:hypothetical protein